jgi:hypothetical protein
MRLVLAAIATIVLTLGTAWASDHSGTVMVVDPQKGTIVLGEVGPWHVKDGQTEITRRTIAVEPSTQFVMLKRSLEPGPSGWPGDFVEMPLGAWAVKGGDFVTVRVDQKEKRSIATRIAVTVIAE